MENNKIKVLQVFGALNVGGAESRMMDVYRTIDRDQVQFDFVSLSQEKQFFEAEIRALGGNVYKLESPRKCGIIKHIQDLRACMRQGQFDAVHAHTSYHCGLVMLAAKLEHIPVRISHARTTGSVSKNKMKAVLLSIGRKLISQYSTHCFAISRDAGTFLFGRHKFTVIPNAIDFEKYQNIPDTCIAKLKKELNLPEEAPVIGQIGRFSNMKNHEFTLKWFEEYLQTEPNARLVLVGDGPRRVEMENLAHKLNIENRVIFTGVRNDVHELIHTFDVLFFPSLYEGLGGVAIEAQAAGIPCVESDKIPQETDLGLGLILRCSLGEPMGKWTDCVESARRICTPQPMEIQDAFDRAGYSLKAVTQQYVDAYCSRSK